MAQMNGMALIAAVMEVGRGGEFSCGLSDGLTIGLGGFFFLCSWRLVVGGGGDV